MSYGYHLRINARAALRCLSLALAHVVHGLLPFMFSRHGFYREKQ